MTVTHGSKSIYHPSLEAPSNKYVALHPCILTISKRIVDDLSMTKGEQTFSRELLEEQLCKDYAKIDRLHDGNGHAHGLNTIEYGYHNYTMALMEVWSWVGDHQPQRHHGLSLFSRLAP